MKLSKTQTAIIAIIIANTIWGAASPVYKWSFENIHPFTLAFLRFLFSALILFPFVKGSLKIKHKDILIVLLIGASLTLHIGILFIALTLTTSINSPIIGSSTPIFILIFGILFLREIPTAKKMVGGLIGFLGVLLIILQPTIEKGLDGSIVGNALLVAATLLSVINILLIKSISKRYKPLTLVFWSFALATLFFIPFFTQEVQTYGFLTNLNMQGIIGILYATLLSSVAAYGLYYYAIKYMQVFDVGVFSYVDPIVGIIVAVSLLSEIPFCTHPDIRPKQEQCSLQNQSSIQPSYLLICHLHTLPEYPEGRFS